MTEQQSARMPTDSALRSRPRFAPYLSQYHTHLQHSC